MNEQLRNWSQPTENNKDAILEKLTCLLPTVANVLEVGSGTGQHAIYFSEHLTHLRWQPTDRAEIIQDLRFNVQHFAPNNVAQPLVLDLNKSIWPIQATDHLFLANVIHIMPEALLIPLLEGAKRIMAAGGLLIFYGPFKYHGAFTTESNESFDGWLKNRNILSGIRDFEVLCEHASARGFRLQSDYSLPANNQLLVFRNLPV